MLSRYASLAGYALLIVLALAIGVVSLRYATFNPAVAPDELRPNMGRTRRYSLPTRLPRQSRCLWAFGNSCLAPGARPGTG
jgi:hypothetical protein